MNPLADDDIKNVTPPFAKCVENLRAVSGQAASDLAALRSNSLQRIDNPGHVCDWRAMTSRHATLACSLPAFDEPLGTANATAMGYFSDLKVEDELMNRGFREEA